MNAIAAALRQRLNSARQNSGRHNGARHKTAAPPAPYPRLVMKPTRRGYEEVLSPERVRLHMAYDVGYARGVSDSHHETRDFGTGAEWLSWLEGWREGQKHFKQRVATITNDANRREKEMEQIYAKRA